MTKKIGGTNEVFGPGERGNSLQVSTVNINP